MTLTPESDMQGTYHLHYHRTLGSCNPVEAFASGGSSGALAEWLQPYDGLSDCSLMDTSQRLGLQRSARPQPPVKQACRRIILPTGEDSTPSYSGVLALFRTVVPVAGDIG